MSEVAGGQTAEGGNVVKRLQKATTWLRFERNKVGREIEAMAGKGEGCSLLGGGWYGSHRMRKLVSTFEGIGSQLGLNIGKTYHLG